MKDVAVKIAGSDQPPIDRRVAPGTTAGELLADLGLAGYLLSNGPNAKRFWGDDENIYPLVQDGDKVYASSPAEVGR
jgi:hypothetical protein